MPNFEPVVLEARAYSLRHIGPQSALFPNASSPVALTAHAVLAVPAMVGRDLPMANQPNSQDFVSGQWAGRLMDAGEMQLTFPNKEASDGVPWRQRFSPDKKLQWIEIRNDGYLESVCCIEKIDRKRDQIVISGHDGLWQTKSAYERDWTVVQAPRDVIERGTQVWVPTTVDSFPASSTISGSTLTTPYGTWTIDLNIVGSSVTVGPSGGIILFSPNINASQAIITSSPVNVVPTRAWRAQCTIASADAVVTSAGLGLLVVEADHGAFFELEMGPGGVIFGVNNTSQVQVVVPQAASYNFQLESDGEWVWGFLNGQLIGCARRPYTGTTNQIYARISSFNSPATVAPGGTEIVQGVLVEVLQPFLQRGTDKGDYVLPGSASAYPSGGLHARYSNDLDLMQNPYRPYLVHAPNRSQAYGGSGVQEYANHQDPNINGQSNPQPGASTVGWSCKWFGAIYLKLSAGNYSFIITVPSGLPNGNGLRVWIGKTQWGDQLVDQIGPNNTTPSYSFTVNAASLAGTVGYGGGTVQRDGWYPIRIEYWVDGNAGSANPVAAPVFQFTNTPAAYTDPGGTAIASGAHTVTVPATSFSPLGCVDQRHQGISHFDIIIKTTQAFGYQMAIEPQSLESGLFPGVLAPRLVEGTNYDVVLEPDDQARAEGLVNYGAVSDGTDEVTSLSGNGAGFQNGNAGQLQSLVYDPASLQQALFDLQGWQDFSDASYLELLAALLNSQLGLRLTPWEILTGDPVGRSRLANLWPLPSALAQMRWRPGDGMRVLARDINIQDITPRQLLTVSRQIHPNGATGTLVSFAARPRGHAHAIKQSISGLNRLSRNYQKQLVTLTGNYVQAVSIANTDVTAYSGIMLLPTDKIVRAYVRCAWQTTQFGLMINDVDWTGALSGPWVVQPALIDITPVASTHAGFSEGAGLYVRAINKSGGVNFPPDIQLFIDVLR